MSVRSAWLSADAKVSTCVPAKAKKRNINVPTSSPHAATKSIQTGQLGLDNHHLISTYGSSRHCSSTSSTVGGALPSAAYSSTALESFPDYPAPHPNQHAYPNVGTHPNSPHHTSPYGDVVVLYPPIAETMKAVDREPTTSLASDDLAPEAAGDCFGIRGCSQPTRRPTPSHH